MDHSPSFKLIDADRKALKYVARRAIERELNNESGDERLTPLSPILEVPGASFVTLEHHGRLRGCIGSLIAHRPLYEDVVQNARAAAFYDPRFSPLRYEEFEHLSIEISVLNPPIPVAVANEQELVRRLRPHVDGLILQCGRRRATFLPTVWEQLPTAEEFLLHLKLKAGLASDFWSDDLQFATYTVEKF